MSQNWLQRNVDIVALAVIVGFGGFGSAAASWLESPQRFQRVVVTDIREKTRETAREIRVEINKEMRQAREDVRSDVSRERSRMRDEIRNFRNELREQIRSIFR